MAKVGNLENNATAGPLIIRSGREPSKSCKVEGLKSDVQVNSLKMSGIRSLEMRQEPVAAKGGREPRKHCRGQESRE